MKIESLYSPESNQSIYRVKMRSTASNRILSTRILCATYILDELDRSLEVESDASSLVASIERLNPRTNSWEPFYIPYASKAHH